jgi:hypothetical protein
MHWHLNNPPDDWSPFDADDHICWLIETGQVPEGLLEDESETFRIRNPCAVVPAFSIRHEILDLMYKGSVIWSSKALPTKTPF